MEITRSRSATQPQLDAVADVAVTAVMTWETIEAKSEGEHV